MLSLSVSVCDLWSGLYLIYNKGYKKVNQYTVTQQTEVIALLLSVLSSLLSSESHALSSLSAAVVPPALHTVLTLHVHKHVPGHRCGNKECENVLD